MTHIGSTAAHPEPQFPKSPEAAAGTSSGGGPPAHFDTLARLLALDPALAAESLARLIASEREAAVSELVERVEAALAASEWWHTGGTRCAPIRVIRQALANTT